MSTASSSTGTSKSTASGGNDSRRGSMGEKFLGTVADKMEGSSHVTIVDESSEVDLEQSPKRKTRNTPGRTTSLKGKSRSVKGGPGRSRSPNRRKSSDGSTMIFQRMGTPPKNSHSTTSAMSMSMNAPSSSTRRMTSSMNSGASTSAMSSSMNATGSSTRRMGNQVGSMSFIPTIEDSDHIFSTKNPLYSSRKDDELEDFDDSFVADVSQGSTSERKSTGSAPSRRSFWKNKGEEGMVDQSVNLMDVETGQYDDTTKSSRRKSPQRNRSYNRNAMGKFRQKSLVDIFLAPEDTEAQSRGARKSNEHDPTKDKGRGWAHWFCLALLICLVVAAILTIPAVGLVGGGDGDNKSGSPPEPPKKTNSPTNAPTKAPTPEPAKEETNLEPEEPPKPAEGPVVDTQTEAGPSLTEILAPKETPVSVTSPNPNQNESVNTEAIPSENRQDAAQFIITDQDVSESAALKDANSASAKALKWISEQDPAQLKIPGVDEVNDAVKAERQLVQRYAMAVFFFSQQTSGGDEAGARTRQRQLKEATKEELDNRQKFDKEWLSASSVCQWPGVTCDSNEFVTGLDASDSLLEGTLPREILSGAAFPFLTTLDISFNRLQGTLPPLNQRNSATGRSMLPSESRLQYLFLQENSLEGKLDPIVTLKDLTYLDLSDNQFTGYIPEEFGTTMKKLDSFHVGGNYLQGTLPKGLGSLTQLARLDMKANLFTGSIPREWSQMTGLQSLTLSHCETLEGTIPEALAKMTALKSLHLQETNLNGSIPSFLANLKELKELYLHNTKLTGTMPQEICSLKDGGLQSLTSDCSADLGSVTCTCCTDCFWR